MAGAVRIGVLTLRVILAAGLIAWTAAAPLLWILRDGLGPDAVESAGAKAVGKFLVSWGLPALLLAVLLAGLSFVTRRSAVQADTAAPN